MKQSFTQLLKVTLYLPKTWNAMFSSFFYLQGVPCARRLGFVDLDFECSTVCPTLLGLMGIWQKWLGKMVEIKVKLVNPTQVYEHMGRPVPCCIYSCMASHPSYPQYSLRYRTQSCPPTMKLPLNCAFNHSFTLLPTPLKEGPLGLYYVRQTVWSDDCCALDVAPSLCSTVPVCTLNLLSCVAPLRSSFTMSRPAGKYVGQWVVGLQSWNFFQHCFFGPPKYFKSEVSLSLRG